MLKRMRPFLPALMVLSVSLAATGLSVWAQKETLLSNGQRQFTLQGETLGESIGDVMALHVNLMRAGAGLMNAKGNISREEWQKFIATLELAKEFPGTQGVGYAAVIDKSKDDGGNIDAESGHMVTTIRYLEPENERNQKAIGYDMFSEHNRRIAMERARDTGLASMSARVTLLQEGNENIQPGVLLYVPVYREGAQLQTVADRRQHLQGYVYGAFRLVDLMSQSLVKKNPEAIHNINISIFDGQTDSVDNLLFDSRKNAKDNNRQVAGNEAPAIFNSTIPLFIAGRPWLAKLASQPQFEEKLDWNRISLQLVGGIIISTLMAAIVAGLALARERSQQTAIKLATEVEDRRRAQEQAQLANRELIHRVKNTLAIVNAIASQTARHTRSMNEFIRAFRERLGGLGRVHDLLRPDRAGNPDFRSLLTETLLPYKPDSANALTLEGNATPVARDDAVLLSLFINELATNAIKYGAWSVPGGQVFVSWHVKNETSDDQQLVIHWKESNGPRVTIPDRIGFGTTVMKFAVERSMGGEVKLNYNESGVAHEIRIPWGKKVDSAAPYGQIPNKAT